MTASDPALSAWVHNTLTDSFLTAYRAYGAQPSRLADADRYVREQTKVGELLGAAPLPDTATALSAWVASHPHLAPSPACAQAITFLRHPPLHPRSSPPTTCCCEPPWRPYPPASSRSRLRSGPATHRPGRGNNAAMGTGILTRLAARAGPHRRRTPAAGTIPPATAHDHITGQDAGPA